VNVEGVFGRQGGQSGEAEVLERGREMVTIDDLNGAGKSALREAADRDFVPGFRRLLAHGAQLQLQCADGFSALDVVHSSSQKDEFLQAIEEVNSQVGKGTQGEEGEEEEEDRQSRFQSPSAFDLFSQTSASASASAFCGSSSARVPPAAAASDNNHSGAAAASAAAAGSGGSGGGGVTLSFFGPFSSP